MKMIPRHIERHALEALSDTPVVMLTGPRQAGKSTLARRLAGAMGAETVVSLDDPAIRSAARTSPNGFVASLKRPAVIDEAQRVPELVYGIKEVVDEIRVKGGSASGSFLLTGSSSTWDTLESPESLAGRIERIELWPLSQGELVRRRERFIDAIFENAPPAADGGIGSSQVADLVVRGGYPEARARSERRAQQWFSEYISLVLDRDIRDLANVRRPEDLLRLLRACATRAGSPVNVSSMLSELGVGLSTGRRYYELLARTHLIREIPAWGVNLARAATRAPKLVVADSGLAAHLVECSAAKFASRVSTRPGPGHLFETFVTTELLKAAAWCDADVKPFHWRDQSGREVDLLLERRDGSIVAFEFKLGESAGFADLRHLAYLRDKLGDRFRGGALICTGHTTISFGGRLWMVPVNALWA